MNARRSRDLRQRSVLRRLGRGFGRLLFILVLLLVATLAACRWQASTRETRTRLEAAPATGRFVRAHDVDVFIQERGPADGPVVLFMHGMGAWSEIWQPTMATIAGAGFRAVALDLPPFGYSERPAATAYGRQAQARRIIGLLDTLGVERAYLVGHSFGGGPTMEAVLQAPARVSALVLADAAIGLDAPAGGAGLPGMILGIRPVRDAMVSATVTNPRLTGYLLGQFVADQSAVTDARVQMLQAPLVLSGATSAFGDWLLDFMTSDERPLSQDPAAYRALSLPSLIIWGDRDTTTPLAQGEQLKTLIAGAELAVMPGVGHMPQLEDPPQFDRLLLDFLQKQRHP
jgi:pimeloyl-ACP methyl ester carboxylesterase